MGPVPRIGQPSILGRRLTRIVPRGLDQPVERAGAGNGRGQGEDIPALSVALVPFMGISAIRRL